MDSATLARFLGKVEIDSGCWLWQGAMTSKGYGHMWAEGKTRAAHRLAYEHYQGSIPDGLQVDHLCRIRRCVNPAHLEIVTCRENIRRGHAARGSKLDPHKEMILAKRAAGVTYMSIARSLGVSDSTVFECVRGWSAAA